MSLHKDVACEGWELLWGTFWRCGEAASKGWVWANPLGWRERCHPWVPRHGDTEATLHARGVPGLGPAVRPCQGWQGKAGGLQGEEEEVPSTEKPSRFPTSSLEGFGLVTHPFPRW